ncbi:hypothetical protein JXD38_09845 [candidate division WOR-3 bacterium]|nr:hypothetical protein [candidate division WOR-3 bacterium]
MNKALIVGAVLLGAVLGVGGYHLAVCGAGKGSTRVESSPSSFQQADLAEIRKHLAAIETRLAKVEAKPGFNEVLDDPTMRERLAAAMVEARNPGMVTPRPPVQGPEAWREGMAARYRADYAKVLDEARKALKVDEAKWKEVQPVFEKHFAPVDAALKDLATGKSSAPPKINDLVAPGLPATLSTLQKLLGPEAWQAFDSWRKAEEQGLAWGAGKGDYFLDGDEFKSYQVKRAVQMHWPVLQGSLSPLYERLALDAQKKEEVEAVIKAHLSKAFEAFKDAPRIDLQSDDGRAKVKSASAATEAELGKILGTDGLQKFREWKSAPGNRAAVYFGEAVKAPQPGAVRPPTAPGPRPGSGEGHPQF